MARIPVGLQLFSVRGECSKDLPATLKAVAGLGYVAVEPWGYGGDKLEWMGHAPKAIRTMLDDNGLACCGIHLGTGALLGDNLARTIELNQALGNRFLIIAADKPRMSSLDGFKELAGILDGTAAKLKPLGMSTGYHAHPFDFVQVSHLHLALRGQVRNEDVTPGAVIRFAHTSPFYVTVGGQKPRDPEAARFYAGWLDELIAATEKKQAGAKDPKPFEPVLATYRRARAVYAGAAAP